MKVSDIIKEGVLSSLVKGMAKGAGLDDVTLAKRPGQLPSAVTTQATQTTTTTAKPRGKKDFNVVVNDLNALTVNYQGQTYTKVYVQGKPKWVITKTDKDVAPHWAKVLDTELKKYQDEAGFKSKLLQPTQPQKRKAQPKSVDMPIKNGPNRGLVHTFYYDDKTKTWSHPEFGKISDENDIKAMNKQLTLARQNWQMSSNFIPDQT